MWVIIDSILSTTTTSHIYGLNNDLDSLDLHSSVIIELTLFSEFLSKKLTTFSIPHHIPLVISKFEKDTQLEITQKIIKLIKSQDITDNKFSWPSIKELRVLCGTPKKTKSYVTTVKGVTPTSKQIKVCDYLVKHTKNIICIAGNDTHPTYLINKKTNSVSIVSDKKSIISLEDVTTEKIYIIPFKLTKFLELDNLSRLKITKFQDHKSLLLQTKNINTKGILITI